MTITKYTPVKCQAQLVVKRVGGTEMIFCSVESTGRHNKSGGLQVHVAGPNEGSWTHDPETGQVETYSLSSVPDAAYHCPPTIQFF